MAEHKHTEHEHAEHRHAGHKHSERKGVHKQIGSAGDQLVGTVKKVLHEGYVRRVVIRNKAGKTVLDMPLTAGVVGTVLAPGFAAVGAIAAIASGMSIAVDRPQANASPTEPSSPELPRPPEHPGASDQPVA